MAFHVPHEFRVHNGPMGSEDSIGNAGSFSIRFVGAKLTVIASDGDEEACGLEKGHWGPIQWEHVSVSTLSRCPTWLEMCHVKRLFWGPDDCVLQFHPPESDYVNNHPFVLHMWRPIDSEIPMPPIVMV